MPLITAPAGQIELGLQSHLTHSMRWKLRQHSFFPGRTYFDPSRHGINVLAPAEAKKFVISHHYSGSFPYAVVSFGLFEKDTFTRGRLVGVAVFATPSNLRTFPSYLGLPSNAGLELGRFVLLDEVAANAETWFLARCLRALPADRPGVRAILSYSDPVPRTDLAGNVIFSGHIGRCYTAAHYLGRGRPKQLYLSADGRALANRIFNKLRKGECGAAYAEKVVTEAPGLAREPGENPADYLARALTLLRAFRHPGNHVFCFPLGTPTERKRLMRAPTLLAKLHSTRPSAPDEMPNKARVKVHRDEGRQSGTRNTTEMLHLSPELSTNLFHQRYPHAQCELSC